MANNFSMDGNCKALYRFENGALTADSKGTNTLAVDSGAPSADLVNFKEGAASCLFDADSFNISDANLDAGFPLKNGDAIKKISIAVWFRARSVTGTDEMIFEKGAAFKSSFYLKYDSTSIVIGIGYSGGSGYETATLAGLTITDGHWYHIGVTFNDADKSYRIRVWDDTANNLEGEKTGNTANNVNIEDGELTIGTNNANYGPMDGMLDELVFFNDILLSAEIDEIRAGTYGASAPPTVTTQAVEDITRTTATGHGTITETGGETVHTRGICWDTNPTPTTGDNTSEDNGAGDYGVGAYSKAMTGLTPGEHYYVRAYAINSEGTSYGNEVEFDASPPQVTAKVVDITYLTPTSGYIWYVDVAANNFLDDAVVDNGGGDEITIDGTPAVDPTFYEMGEIEMTSGDNNGQQRPVALDAAGVITVLWPFVTAIASNDNYNLYPGCDLRGITCHHKYHNEDIFRGFIYVPRIEDTIM